MAGETLPSGSTNTQGLADWAAPYITNYLGKAQALSETPYQAYKGPLTAGASNLQNKVFNGLAGLTFPSNLGQSFASPAGGQQSYPTQTSPAFAVQKPMGNQALGPGATYRAPGMPMEEPMPIVEPMPDYLSGEGDIRMAVEPPTEADWNLHQQTAMYMPGTDMEKAKADFMSRRGQASYTGPELGATTAAGGMQPQVMPQQGGIASLQPPQPSMQPSNIAQTYMNPYLQAVLAPQLDELRRQNDITNMATNAKLTGAGAFGGGRQAIMNAENNRNLMMEQNKTVGQGYASAYDKAMQQFNTEQGQAKDLVNLMAGQGATERGIDAEGIAADKEEFEKQRQYPFQQVQWQRDMISGLPTGSVTNQAGQMSGIGSFLNALGGGTAAASALGYKNVGELLKGLGLDFGP